MKFFGEENGSSRKISIRSTILFVIIVILFFINLVILFSISCKENFREASVDQSSYKMSIASVRGTIYDKNLKPLTNTRTKRIAVVIPTPETLHEVTEKLGQEKLKLFDSGLPFICEIPADIKFSSPNIDIFEIPDRENDEEYHIIGYIDSDSEGVAGIEASYNDVLKSFSGEISIQYSINAINNVISPSERIIKNQTDNYKGGIVTTIDKSLQNAVKSILEEYVEKGCAIVSKTDTGEITAIVSAPIYSADNLSKDINSDNGSLLNRALYPYEVGSVFKITAAAAALESGINSNDMYFCDGSCEVDGMDFDCYNGLAHGSVDMKSAVSESCNGYFIKCMQRIPPKSFLDMSYSMGFGTKHEIAAGIFSSDGVLPSEESLKVPRALANFSFGQGEFTATPIQINAMTNVVANSGNYVELKAVEGIVNPDMTFVKTENKPETHQILSQKTVNQLKNYMGEAVIFGTAQSGRPSNMKAAAKTGTAQTGRYDKNGDELVNHWYTGFYPFFEPEYTITVLEESVPSNREFVCGYVFKEITDYLYNNGYIKNN